MAEFPEIPGCKIVSVLGQGGMATIYLGVQEKLNRKVAIKVLETSRLKDKMVAERFERAVEGSRPRAGQAAGIEGISRSMGRRPYPQSRSTDRGASRSD